MVVQVERERMRMEMALPLRFFREECHPRIKLEETDNLKLDTSPCEDLCFVKLLCGFSSSNAYKMMSYP